MRKQRRSGLLAFTLSVVVTMGTLFLANQPHLQKTGNLLPKSLAFTLGADGIPPTTTSIYEHAGPADDAMTLEQGCDTARATVGGLVILDWGAIDDSQGFGTVDWSYTLLSDNDIERLVESFLAGMWNCRTSNTDFAVAIGLSNWGNCGCTNPDAASEQASSFYQTGQAWGKMVNNVEKYVLTRNMGLSIVLAAADDMEQDVTHGWGTAAHTMAFVDGYTAAIDSEPAMPPRYLYDFGDDEGMVDDHSSYPPVYSPQLAWSMQVLYYIAFGAKYSLPIPEIYFYGMAIEWAQVSAWACKNPAIKAPMRIAGIMTEYPYLDTFDQVTAWAAMVKELKADSCTKPMASQIAFSTNIGAPPCSTC